MAKKRVGYSRRDVLKKSAIATSALVIGGTAASGTAVAGVGDGRVGHYHLNNLHLNKDTDEKEKNHVHDASPEKNHGTNKGAEVVKDGAVGKAFEFVENDEEWVDVNHTLLDGATSATIAGWFNANKVNTAGGVFGHRLALNRERGGLTFRVTDADFSGNENGSVELIVNGWEGENVEVAFDYADDQWHHLTGVYDGSKAEVYIDGEYKDDVGYNNALDPYGHFDIGRYKWEDQGDEWYYDGLVDEVRVYDRALSDDEIVELATMDEE